MDNVLALETAIPRLRGSGAFTGIFSEHTPFEKSVAGNVPKVFASKNRA